MKHSNSSDYLGTILRDSGPTLRYIIRTEWVWQTYQYKQRFLNVTNLTYINHELRLLDYTFNIKKYQFKRAVFTLNTYSSVILMKKAKQ